MKGLTSEITRMLEELTPEQLEKLFNKLRTPEVMKAYLEDEKLRNFKKYGNRPK